MLGKVMGRACGQAVGLVISAWHIRSSIFFFFFLHKTKIETNVS